MAKRPDPKKAAKKKIDAPVEATHRPFAAALKAKKKPAKEEASDAKAKAPVKVAPPKAAPRQTDDRPVDASTFAIYMAGVKTLDDKPSRIPKTASRLEKSEMPELKTDLDAPAREQFRSLVAGGVRFESTDDGERIEGRRIDVDPRDLRRLRRGAFAIDAKLDLHGRGLEEARGAVEAFVKKRAAEGDRCVIIIHGKGLHSPRQMGVLRGEIGAWLSGGSASRHVNAFATAGEDDGGAGAILVLLAR